MGYTTGKGPAALCTKQDRCHVRGGQRNNVRVWIFLNGKISQRSIAASKQTAGVTSPEGVLRSRPRGLYIGCGSNSNTWLPLIVLGCVVHLPSGGDRHVGDWRIVIVIELRSVVRRAVGQRAIPVVCDIVRQQLDLVRPSWRYSTVIEQSIPSSRRVG